MRKIILGCGKGRSRIFRRYSKMEDAIFIGKRREVFWDMSMIDADGYGTLAKLHEPVRRECVLAYDEPWGGDTLNYIAVVQDEEAGVYRMYTAVGKSYKYVEKHGLEGGEKRANIAYAESTDGVNWTKPNLGIADFRGSKDNNFIFDLDGDNKVIAEGFDGFSPMIDTNPNCKPEEKYKAVANLDCKLWLFTSADGIHFTMRPDNLKISAPTFDSHNSILFNKETGMYECFIRDFHATPDPEDSGWQRDIRKTESEDLIHWSIPVQLRYDVNVDWQMYTNEVVKYYRADHVYIGFPSRLNMRTQWNDSYDELPDREGRLERLNVRHDQKSGLALSDTMFMTSRDGRDWTRYPDCYLRPGPEHKGAWVYGSVYVSNGIIETPACHPGCDPEISFYCGEGRFTGEGGHIYRYTTRRDGFVSQFAPWHGCGFQTKRFIFDGSELYINFATSVYGIVKVTMVADDGRQLHSHTLFGDKTDRIVRWKDGEAKDFAGVPVRLKFDMQDADVYSFKFE